jgi:3-hydroxyisobutyrate dehydrogenase
LTTIGFVGAGNMGAPMAARLITAGPGVLLWNRTRARLEHLVAAGGRIAASLDELFDHCDTIILMLADDAAVADVLGLRDLGPTRQVEGRTVVNMGTGSAANSRRFSDAIRKAGGSYVEAPVSGSRGPAEQGRLVAMVAGDSAETRERIRNLIAPMCRATFDAGQIPSALSLKLAVNLYLVTTVAALAEAYHLGHCLGLDLATMRDILDSGPMASDVSRIKGAMMVDGDFSPQATIADVLKNCRLISDAALGARACTPLLEETLAAFARTERRGDGRLDMAAVIRAAQRYEAQGPAQVEGPHRPLGAANDPQLGG